MFFALASDKCFCMFSVSFYDYLAVVHRVLYWQQYSNISCIGSLDEIMLNLQLYRKYIYFMMVCRLLSCLYVYCIVALLALEHAW